MIDVFIKGRSRSICLIRTSSIINIFENSNTTFIKLSPFETLK